MPPLVIVIQGTWLTGVHAQALPVSYGDAAVHPGRRRGHAQRRHAVRALRLDGADVEDKDQRDQDTSVAS